MEVGSQEQVYSLRPMEVDSWEQEEEEKACPCPW